MSLFSPGDASIPILCLLPKLCGLMSPWQEFQGGDQTDTGLPRVAATRLIGLSNGARPTYGAALAGSPVALGRFLGDTELQR